MTFLKKGLCELFRERLWLYTLSALLIKSILFLGFIISSNHAKIDLLRGFYSVSSFPLYICFIILFLSFSFLFKKRFWFYFLINSAVSFLMLMDLWYFRAGIGSFITVHVLRQTTNLSNLSDSIISFIYPLDLVFVVDLVFLLLLNLKKQYTRLAMERSCALFTTLFLLSGSYISYIPIKVDLLGLHDPREELFHICWTPNQTISNLSPLGYHLYDIYNFWKDCQPLTLSAREKADIANWFTQNKILSASQEKPGAFQGKNLLIIQVESLESFVINQKINGQEITPTLNRLLKSSYYFPNIYEQVYNGVSSDSDLMTNTSLYPIRRGSTFFRYPNNTYNSLPKLLGEKGYATLAIHPDKGSYWNWRESLQSMGFSQCIDAASFTPDELIGLGLSDGTFFRQAEPLIARQKQPFYTFMVTLTNHAPFDLPTKYRELSLDNNLDASKIGGYFQSIHYTDKQLGILLNRLDQDGIIPNTAVVIIGDHTGIHKFYQNELDAQPGEGWWQQNNKCVPFIIYQDGLKGHTYATIGGQIDIMPTLCFLWGIPPEKISATAMGKNLFNSAHGFAVLADGTFIGDQQAPELKEHAVQGIEIADKIIRSNYFESFVNK